MLRGSPVCILLAPGAWKRKDHHGECGRCRRTRSSDELEELYRLDASESEPEAEPDDDDEENQDDKDEDENEEGIKPEGMPHG
jgi:hypothetical protein